MKNTKFHYIVATAIIIKDAPWEKAFPSQWSVPGGKLESDDYMKLPRDGQNQWYNIAEKLLEREVMEEVSLKIKNVKYLCDLVFIRPDNIPVVTLSYSADWASGKVKLAEDQVDFAWVDLKEAKKYKLIEGIYDELKMLDKVLKGKKVIRWIKDKSLSTG
ncbi:MAG: hypothetical protein HW405_785 [Candidatus Berkelbacteria bacterium]|nr:hypothetical protein [Candidatus Berkelbacteria bacterium]